MRGDIIVKAIVYLALYREHGVGLGEFSALKKDEFSFLLDFFGRELVSHCILVLG